MTLVTSAQATRYAKAYLYDDDVLADGIVAGTLDASGNGTLSNRNEAVTSETYVVADGPYSGTSVPVWHVAFPSTLNEAGGEPHVRVAADDTAYAPVAIAFIGSNPNRAARHTPTVGSTAEQQAAFNTVVDAYYTQ